MTIAKTLKTACWAGVLIALAGCGDSISFKVYEPGVYKGASDPLIAELAKPESKQRLQERFTEGQADR